MAMRGRGGRGNPNRPPRLVVGRVYEQFKPMSEWRQEDDYDTLLVYLPGFQKEYIKVTTEDLNIVRLRGERLIAENKWSRFQEDYKVPENCEMRGIRARFDGGILTITMPRKIVVPPPIATTQVTPKTEEQPFRRTQEEALPKPKAEPKDNTLPPSTSKPTKHEMPPSTSKPTKHEPVPPPTSKPTKHEPVPPSTSKPKHDKPQIKPLKATLQAKEANEEFKSGSLPTHVPKKDKQDIVEKPNIGENTDLKEGKGKEALLEKETKRNFEGKTGQLNNAHVGFQGDKVEENKKVLARRGVLNEDRKVLVNVGVGVLV
ncbi:inactive protein restricted TEV movement 2-like protein [Tanacetum coccineum]|uniref:Inactive protein restricted TEV movement 2-like protein n=1 Tax=Tanacetum coccineum TaxID=301880 RepID=A0ABQ5CN63_9ASTR